MVTINNEQRDRDIALWGLCWCGQPRYGDIIDDPRQPGGKMSVLRCYAEDTHELTFDAIMRRNP